MPANDALLFIDAHVYLDLYRMVEGRKIFAALGQQGRTHFRHPAGVDEVNRRKIEVAADFLGKQFTKLKLQTFGVHEHLFGANEEDSKRIREKMKAISQQVDQLSEDVKQLGLAIMDKVSKSTDEVSEALAPIFANAVPGSDLQGYRTRRGLRLTTQRCRSTGNVKPTANSSRIGSTRSAPGPH